jgi:hypothetical protein
MVILNTIVLGLENIGTKPLNEFRAVANNWFTWIFVVEMILKVYAFGIRGYC